MPNSVSSICRSNCRPATTTAAIGPATGLFGESLVALDVKTGKRKWHYQLVHHGIWDMDIPCAPILADITVNGRAIKAIAQPTKQGWVYVFDRATGQPVWPIEERPVEKGTCPASGTRRRSRSSPSRRPFDRQGVSVDDLIDFTPELHAEAVKTVGELQDRSDLHAAGREHVAGTAGDAHHAVGDRWRELAGRRARSGDEHHVHLLEHAPTALGLVPADPARTDFGIHAGRQRAIRTRRRRPARRPRRRARRQAQRRQAPSRGSAAGGGRWRAWRGAAPAAAAPAGGGGGGEGGGGLTVQGCRSSSRRTRASPRST